jgi:uncharacterized protein (DUF433 family)
MKLDRITFDPHVMGGQACIRGLRVPVTVVLGLLADGATEAQILSDYPYLEPDDIRQCLAFAAALARDEVVPS